MKQQTVKFTDTDRKILNSYITVIDGLANYLGNGYEIVLHSLEDLEHSVIHIVNGEHTGRKVGVPITDLALEMLNKIETENKSELVYFTRNKKGELLKSATIVISGEGGKTIGLLCMNLYLNTPFMEMAQTFLPVGEKAISVLSKENFVENSDELILTALQSARAKVMEDAKITPSNKNKAIIALLNENGIFNIKDSVIKAADFLGISKNTVYMHLRNVNGK